jgi:hypothetical protein
VRCAVVVLALSACGRSGFDIVTDADSSVGADGASSTNDATPGPWAPLGPVGYYPFDGDTTDLAYAGGTFPCSSCTYESGRRGMAVKVTAQPLPARPVATAGFTMAAWIYVPSLFPGALAGCPTLIAAAGYLEADDEPASVMLYGSNYSPNSSGLVDVNADGWTHVAMTYVAATGAMSLYVDATLRNGTTATIADSLDFARISAANCNVMIDDLYLFDRVLGASELATVRDL